MVEREVAGLRRLLFAAGWSCAILLWCFWISRSRSRLSPCARRSGSLRRAGIWDYILEGLYRRLDLGGTDTRERADIEWREAIRGR